MSLPDDMTIDGDGIWLGGRWCPLPALAELRQERDELARCLDGGVDCAAERIEARSDARRYRHLRDHAGNTIMRKLMAVCTPDKWNEMVDADMTAPQREAK